MNLLPPENRWSTPQRQAKAGLLISLLKAFLVILKTLWPLLLILVIRGSWKSSGIGSLAIVLPALVLLRSITEYYYFRFYIAGNELIVKEGFINKKTIAIPLGKIQAVHIEQSVLHRLLKIVKMKIDTAGSEKAEVIIDSLELHKAEHLKSFLLHEQPIASPEAATSLQPKEIPFIHLSTVDLLKMGLSANHLQALLAVAIFAVSLLGDLEQIFGKELVGSYTDAAASNSASFTLVTLLLAFFILLLVCISMINIVLRYYGFTLAETPKGFRLQTGLLHTKQYLVRFSKIQFISWKANWVHQKLGLYHLVFHQTSGDKLNKKEKADVPVNKAAYIEKILAHYHEQLPGKEDSVHRLHPVYAFRKTLLSAILPAGFLLLIGQLFFFHSWFFLLALWIPYVFLNASVFRKKFRLYISPEAFQINNGVWGRKAKIVMWYKIQQVSLQQSIYQRHHQLASLEISTAGGDIHIPYISLELAQLIQNYALYKVEQSNEAWM